LLIYGLILGRHFSLHTAVMALGSLSWLYGNLLWILDFPTEKLLIPWMIFACLTIAGERLELSRLKNLTVWSRVSIIFIAIIILTANAVILANSFIGITVLSIGLLLLTIWLLSNDIAFNTVRRKGLPRFTAFCLIAGYFWLAVAGGIGLLDALPGVHFAKDAFIHSFFLGFVFMMIMGHAPIIFSAVVGLSIQFKRSFYLHFLLLNFSLSLRILGDLAHWSIGVRWGGLLNAASIILFLTSTGSAVMQGLLKRKSVNYK